MNVSQPITCVAIGAAALCASLAFVESGFAHETGHGYIVMGDSIDNGLGASEPDKAYVPQFHAYLETGYFNGKADLHNLSVPGATARQIVQGQMTQAQTDILTHNSAKTPVVLSFGGGGNDLRNFIQGPEAATCMQGNVSCLARLNALLNEIQQTVDHALRTLRETAGPQAKLFVRTQYNPYMKIGCDPTGGSLAQLGNLVLEGTPTRFLIRGLNDRLRDLALKHGVKVIDTFYPFSQRPNELIAEDCIHPNDAGHAVIRDMAVIVF